MHRRPHRLLLATIFALSACAARRNAPPLVGSVSVATEPDGLLWVELHDVVNPSSGSIEVCLDNVIIMQPGGGESPSCSFKRAARCYIVGPGAAPAAPVRFRAPILCPDIDPKDRAVLVDLRWRPWPSNADWRTVTLFDIR